MSKVPSNRGPGKREEGAAAWASDGDTPSANCGCLSPQPVGQRPMSSGEASVSQDSCVSTAARMLLWETEVTPPKLPSQGWGPHRGLLCSKGGDGGLTENHRTWIPVLNPPPTYFLTSRRGSCDLPSLPRCVDHRRMGQRECSQSPVQMEASVTISLRTQEGKHPG